MGCVTDEMLRKEGPNVNLPTIGKILKNVQLTLRVTPKYRLKHEI